jgi:hypothetical protein
MADYLIKVERIDSKVMPQKRHEDFMAGRQMNWGKSGRIHIDTRLAEKDRLTQRQELAQSSVKINHIILIRPAHEQNRSCVGQAQNHEKDLGRMKPIPVARQSIRSLPEASQEKETGNGHS